MNPSKYPLLALICLFYAHCYCQEEQSPVQTNQQRVFARPNQIKSGFTLKLGPVIPVGAFADGQTILNLQAGDTATFVPAKTGANLGLGFLIYLGPGVAANHLRFGIDAGFIDIWFASAKRPPTSGKSDNEFWYYFVGQKFGPLITINPVDLLMIDLSYKLNANISWHNNDFGYNITGQEVQLNLRYRVILVSFLYNFGKVNYNDFDNTRPKHNTDISTFRVLFGFKF